MSEHIGKVYYYNCRLNGDTALLAGPFESAELAEKCGEYVGPTTVDEHPEARKATFGVVEMNKPGAGAGFYNYLLPNELIGFILIDTEAKPH